jgi:hypothetical protein
MAEGEQGNFRHQPTFHLPRTPRLKRYEKSFLFLQKRKSTAGLLAFGSLHPADLPESSDSVVKIWRILSDYSCGGSPGFKALRFAPDSLLSRLSD